MSLIPGIAGQKTELLDGVKVDNITEYTVGNGLKIQGRTDGSAPASGYVGETAFAGTTQILGSGGYIYEVRTNTPVGNGGWAITASLTLNKGVYIVKAEIMSYPTSGTRRLSMNIGIGNSTKLLYVNPTTLTSNAQETTVGVTIPVIITSDSVAVNLIAGMFDTGGGPQDTASGIMAMRIA